MTVNDLLDVIFRWAHLIAGIMWIGNSMLFNWLDRNLEKPDEPEVSMRPPIPAILSDLKRIDTAWTALQQQIDQDCG